MKLISKTFKFIYIFLLLLCGYSHNSLASNSIAIIYDAEAESIIKEIAKPIFDAANLSQPKIFLVSNKTPNAFTIGGESIFINTGLITKFNDPDVLRGVIAHEVGHINGGHSALRQVNIDQEQRKAFVSVIIGMVTALATQNSEAALHSSILSMHNLERSVLKFSRIQESSADQAAYELLEKSGHTSSGLFKLFEYLKENNIENSENSYDYTHPLTQERMDFLLSLRKKSKFIDSKNSSKLIANYEKLCAKLAAYTEEEPSLSKLSSRAASYGNAILEMKNSNKIKSLSYIDPLLNTEPNNPYYNELKGQILLHFGDINSLKFFAKAYELSNDPIIKVEYSIATILYHNDNTSIVEAINSLESTLFTNPNSLTCIEFLSIAYDKIGKKGESLYYKSRLYADLGKTDKAKKLAARAKNLLENTSPFFLKADDIIRTEY